MPPKRDSRTGRFKMQNGCYKDDKGYIRISAGPQRGQRLHRLIAAAKLGRPLKPDEDTHHRNTNKLDNDPSNIEVMGHAQHSCVSAKQHHYLKSRDIELKRDWDGHFQGGADVAFP